MAYLLVNSGCKLSSSSGKYNAGFLAQLHQYSNKQRYLVLYPSVAELSVGDFRIEQAYFHPESTSRYGARRIYQLIQDESMPIQSGNHLLITPLQMDTALNTFVCYCIGATEQGIQRCIYHLKRTTCILNLLVNTPFPPRARCIFQ